jgi:tetraacyldisaccharide 4'-kinase
LLEKFHRDAHPSSALDGFSLLFARVESCIIHAPIPNESAGKWSNQIMLRPTEFRDLVSGRRKSLAAAFSRGVLRAAEVPYTLAVAARNRRYDRGATLVHNVCVPVISVGNLTLGGTGKTPMVKWLAQRLQNTGVRTAIVSRGYGGANGAPNDEALELAAALPNVPHVQNSDRVAAATRAIHEFKSQILLLDDGFQHRRLGRDLDIVLLDALEPFGFEHVFPRGTLREPLAGLRRANLICLSRADVISLPQRDAIRKRVATIAPRAAWCEAAHMACRLVNARGQSQPLEALAGHRVAAFCGIGNPAGFRHTLAATRCDPVAWREYPDHHAYTSVDRSDLIELALGTQAGTFVCTQKDLVKLRSHELGNVPLWAVAIEMQFLRGQESLERMVDDLINARALRGTDELPVVGE